MVANFSFCTFYQNVLRQPLTTKFGIFQCLTDMIFLIHDSWPGQNSETSETSESSEFCFRLFLFRLFDFDLILKMENLEEENLEKKIKALRAFQGFRVFDLPLFRIFNQVS